MSKQEVKQSYVCIVYGGLIKSNYTLMFVQDNEYETRLESLKDSYGQTIKAKCLSFPSDDKAKVELVLSQLESRERGVVFQTAVTNAAKSVKEKYGGKMKSFVWNTEEKDPKDPKDPKDSKEAKPKVPKAPKAKSSRKGKKNSKSKDGSQLVTGEIDRDDTNDNVELQGQVNQQPRPQSGQVSQGGQTGVQGSQTGVQGVGHVGQGTQTGVQGSQTGVQGVGHVGQGGGQGVGHVGQGGVQGVGHVGQGVGHVGQGVGHLGQGSHVGQGGHVGQGAHVVQGGQLGQGLQGQGFQPVQTPLQGQGNQVGQNVQGSGPSQVDPQVQGGPGRGRKGGQNKTTGTRKVQNK
jgi:hypothetical protein